ncbi:Putative transporter, GPR1/FUN34/yaaH family [Desulfonema limicola]|uniref:Transporter, GPR1/FUN34/yaaH family n=1 Tax=Desulfonema limicola TaxID=45656 RepID=A0A975BCI8_9BACT|nr:acetate uptake transporter [Desulfonema limicola]QTA82853.1 Putative transporter, GPR1/FUN34/yaaH family [Desulfonema limicola]
MSGVGQGNPAVVGLAGFGLTTLLLQFHNLGWCGTGVIFCTAMMLGGGAQIIAGFQEFKCGNNFGYSAFTVYGAFWLALGLIWLISDLQAAAIPGIGSHLKITGHDIGMFLVGFTLYTLIMWFAAMRVHGMMAFTFTTLLIGFIGLDLVFLAGMKSILTLTAIVLIVCALSAWYMMAHVIYLSVFGKDILPVGKPWIGAAPDPAPALKDAHA